MKKYKNIGLFCFVVILNYLSCDVPNDKVQETFKYSVNCILSTENGEQKVYFIRVRDIDEVDKYGPGYYDSIGVITFIPEATVKINNYVLKEFTNTPAYSYYYYSIRKSEIIKPGNEYNLEIKYYSDIITGKTKVPGEFSIISHPKDSVYQMQKGKLLLPLVWNKSINAKGYLFQFTYPLNPDPHFLISKFYSEAKYQKDTTLLVEFTGCKRFTVKIAAYDENFEKYYINGNKISGVNNAYGVFSSICVDSIIVDIKP